MNDQDQVEFSNGIFATYEFLLDTALTPEQIAKEVGLPFEQYVEELKSHFAVRAARSKARFPLRVDDDGTIRGTA